MSVSGILSTYTFDTTAQTVQRSQHFKQEFQQLGQDLKSGDLAAAQADIAALTQSGSQTGLPSSTQRTGPLARAFDKLTQDVQAGNLTAAQQDFAAVRQDFQARAVARHHHAPDAGMGQIMDQLGQALQSGNLSAAQQAYSALQNDLQQFTQTSGVATAATTPAFSASA